jgi:hypothetical protein
MPLRCLRTGLRLQMPSSNNVLELQECPEYTLNNGTRWKGFHSTPSSPEREIGWAAAVLLCFYLVHSLSLRESECSNEMVIAAVLGSSQVALQ